MRKPLANFRLKHSVPLTPLPTPGEHEGIPPNVLGFLGGAGQREVVGALFMNPWGRPHGMFLKPSSRRRERY